MGEGFPQAAGNFSAGARVGGYLLEEQIGQGGMAVVFRALDERLGRQVALKILAPALAADDAFRQRFIRESRAAAAVDDPHIIPVFEAGEAGGALFIAMRYVRGGDVRSLLHREGALDALRVAAIVSPVASALDAAHAAGLVHRDVKPANMLLDMRPGRPDHVYLSDFGLSKEALGATGLTGTGQFLGTVDYAAPEQIGGQHVGGQADQYALGCAAFEMLCGEPPFRRDQGMAVLYAHLSEPPPTITSRRQDLPGALDSVFSRVLAKSPQDRYPSCAEFTRALRQAAGLAPYDTGPRASHPDTEIARAAGDAIAAGGPIASAATQAAGQAPAQAGGGTLRTPSAPTGPQPAYGPPGSPPYIPGLYPPPAPGQYPAGPPYGPSWPADGTPRPRRWPIAVASAIGAAAAVAIVYSIVLVSGHHTPQAGSGPAPGSTATTRPSPAVTAPADSPAQTQPPASPSLPATGPASTQAGPGWTTYQDSSGFSVRLPPGWAESSATRTGTYPGVNFTGPSAGFDLFISWSRITGPSALGAWQQLDAQHARNDPTYQRVNLQQVSYRGYDAAVWEFTDIHDGVLTHVIDWGFVVKPGVEGYAIELYGPQASWPGVYDSIWNEILASFVPAS
ncbi:MAG TPA: protein kinase [Streptosporangiaceae bacterium]|nr:protein kinase [Streptosporangiaceae bacterium]